MKSIVVQSLKLKKRFSKSSAFSLMEILIALTLMVIAGSFVATKVFERFTEGNINSTKIQMQSLATILDEYRRKCRSGFPQKIDDLVTPPESCPGGKSGFIEGGNNEVPKDAWENDFLYEVGDRGRSYVLKSLGPDKEEGGTDLDADICSYSGNVKNCAGESEGGIDDQSPSNEEGNANNEATEQ